MSFQCCFEEMKKSSLCPNMNGNVMKNLTVEQTMCQAVINVAHGQGGSNLSIDKKASLIVIRKLLHMQII